MPLKKIAVVGIRKGEGKGRCCILAHSSYFSYVFPISFCFTRFDLRYTSSYSALAFTIEHRRTY